MGQSSVLIYPLFTPPSQMGTRSSGPCATMLFLALGQHLPLAVKMTMYNPGSSSLHFWVTVYPLPHYSGNRENCLNSAQLPCRFSKFPVGYLASTKLCNHLYSAAFPSIYNYLLHSPLPPKSFAHGGSSSSLAIRAEPSNCVGTEDERAKDDGMSAFRPCATKQCFPRNIFKSMLILVK